MIHNMHHKTAPPDAVYVGRPTIFGNPFTHIADHIRNSDLIYRKTREEAVESYREYFEVRLTDPVFEMALEGLRGKDLVCWCAPLACHAEVIIEYLERTKKNGTGDGG